MIALILAIIFSTGLVSTILVIPKMLQIIASKDCDNIVVNSVYTCYVIAFVYFCIASPMMLTIIFNDAKTDSFIEEAAIAILEK